MSHVASGGCGREVIDEVRCRGPPREKRRFAREKKMNVVRRVRQYSTRIKGARRRKKKKYQVGSPSRINRGKRSGRKCGERARTVL